MLSDLGLIIKPLDLNFFRWCMCMHAQLCLTPCYSMDCIQPVSSVHGIFQQEYWSGGVWKRWRRNRTGRPLSPSQIPQKNISTLSKLHKTTSVGWQRTSGNQKSRSLSSKTVFYFSSNFYFYNLLLLYFFCLFFKKTFFFFFKANTIYSLWMVVDGFF